MPRKRPDRPEERSELLAYVEQLVGDNVRALRDVRQLSQRDLAERMTSLGHRWYQNTVSATETGERILGIDEVFDLTIALETSLPRLLDPRGVVGSGPAMIQVGGWATTTQHFADLQRFDRLPVRWTGNDRWEPQGIPEDPAWNEAAHRLRADLEDLDRRAAALRESAGPDLANVRVLVAALVHRMPFHLVLEIAEEVRNLRSRYDEQLSEAWKTLVGDALTITYQILGDRDIPSPE